MALHGLGAPRELDQRRRVEAAAAADADLLRQPAVHLRDQPLLGGQLGLALRA
jgi:hypothetical protein